ncbi:SDR family oxidoreductase [Pseudoroseomonas ludipueritiae]|uniref:SDR family oxidoreductase n=1 Tax=Pseudoroseomonas ludipueritiae TaxID=198093 RepID=A0ABR7RBJ9_9PROT|nr:SDR family oxidoreductase [Pseudoroseomonas ludipueritiae]MBC9179054.1 SDR family oxidoreductase [Pseudoroseomonas ludipueritiae]
MADRLGSPVVVITGASSGIGQATAEAFARDGARLVLAARGERALEEVAARCRSLGADVIAVPTDVTDPEAVERLAVRARGFGGRIDVWVSNVGVGAVGRYHDTPMRAHEQVIRANLLGHMHDAHAAIPHFLRQGRGIFINMISLGGFAAAPFAAAYSASKFGLRGFSEALRAELADHPGIHVCDVYPAFIDTPGLRHGANYTGRALSAPPPVYDARRVAAAIVRLSHAPKPTTTVGWVADATRLAHLLAPNWTTRLMARFMAAYFRRARGAPVTDGNLFAPPADGGRIDGGLRSSRQRMLGLGLLAGCALVLVSLDRRYARR